MDLTYPLFSVFAFLGFFFGLVPLPWHFQAMNAGTCAYMLWASLSCLVLFVNSIVWRNNALNVAPVWCDISSKFLIGASIGIPASSLCISRRLYTIASGQIVTVTYRDKRRALIIDVCVALGIPVLVMALHYVVQGHRYDIFEDIGCFPYIYNTLPAYFLVLMWPVLLGSISFVYSALTLRCFWKRRMQFMELIAANPLLSVSRYIRLLLLASIEMACTVPFGVFNIYMGVLGGVSPWVSWEDTHFDFSEVDQVPSILWRSDSSLKASMEITRWLFPICGLLFFALFGFASEAQKNYRLFFWWLAGFFGIQRQVSDQKPSFISARQNNDQMANSPTQDSLPPTYVSTSSSIEKCRCDSFASSFNKDLPLDLDIEKSAGLLSSCPACHVNLDDARSSMSSSSYQSCSESNGRPASQSSGTAVGEGDDFNFSKQPGKLEADVRDSYESPTLRSPSPDIVRNDPSPHVPS